MNLFIVICKTFTNENDNIWIMEYARIPLYFVVRGCKIHRAEVSV